MIFVGCMLMAPALEGQVHQIHFQHTPPTLPVVFAGNDTLVKCWTPFTLLGQVTGGQPPYTYLWQPGALLNDSTVYNPVGSITQITQFTLTVTDGNGCIVSDQIEVECWVNSIDESGMTAVRVYPVPARGMLFIEGLPTGSRTMEVTLRTLQGEQIAHQSADALYGTLRIPLPNCAAGIYLLEVQTEAGVSMHKIIIQ